MTKHTPGDWVVGLKYGSNKPEGYAVGVFSDDGTDFYPVAYMETKNVEANARLIAAAPKTTAERDRLNTINAELVKTLELISEIQRDKCETAPAEILFMLLDHKVGLASAALAKTKEGAA